MNQKELSIALRTSARAQKKPLCNEWFGEWKDDSSIDDLLDKYVRGIDFCIENDYPTLDFIRENFNRDDLHRHNIYIDEVVDVCAKSGSYVFLGTCSGRIRTSGFSVVVCYLRHDSNISVVSDDMSKVFVSIYESAKCETDSLDASTIKCYDRRKK